MVGAILAVLLSLTPAAEDVAEVAEMRADRLRQVAEAIDAATGDEATQAALISAAWSETRLAASAQRGECPAGAGDCDKGRAKGVWQLHPWCKASMQPSDLVGQAVCARKALRGPLARCGSWERAFGGYASGHGCKPWPERERRRTNYLSKLRAHKARLRSH